MKNLIYLIVLLALSCSAPQTETLTLEAALTENNLISTDGRRLDDVGYKDPAVKNRKKIMFRPTVTEGTDEDILESLEIVSAHKKAVSFNWDFSNGEDLFSDENRAILRVVIYEKGTTGWLSQTSTSGWRGFWVTNKCESGKTYILEFPYEDSDGDGEGAKVEFIMP